MSSSNGKAKVSGKRLPKEAKVQRSGKGGTRKSKGGGRGIMRSFAAPVLVIIMIVLLVASVGYWGKLTPSPTGPAAAEKTPEQSTPVAEELVRAQTPLKEQEPPKDTAILEQRRHIDRAAGAKDTTLLTMYYVDGLTNATTLQPVEVRIPATKGVVRAVAEQVLLQPSDLKLFSSVPVGTKVRSVAFDAETGVATVDLSAEAAGVQGTEAAQSMRAAFIYSLTAIKDVKAVQLWVNGKPAVLHGILWDNPISRQQMDERNPYKVVPVVKFAGP